MEARERPLNRFRTHYRSQLVCPTFLSCLSFPLVGHVVESTELLISFSLLPTALWISPMIRKKFSRAEDLWTVICFLSFPLLRLVPPLPSQSLSPAT